MKNIFVTQFPTIEVNPDEVFDAIIDKSVLASPAWNVWPFLATVKRDENAPEEGLTKADKDCILYMKYVLLTPIKKAVEDENFDQNVKDLLKSLKQKANANSLTAMKQTLLSFRMIFSLCMAASYTKIFYGNEEGWQAFLQTWSNEVTLVCDKDSLYRKTYGTQGLICKNPRELMAVFLKICLAESLANKGNNGAIFEVVKHVSKGAISADALQAVEGFLKSEIEDTLELMKGFLTEQE